MMLPPDDNMDEFASNWDTFRDRLVLFLGAGASIGAKNTAGDPLPSAYALRNDLWQRFKQPPGTILDPADLRLMSLEHASAIIEQKVGRDAIADFLMNTFQCDHPLWSHVALPYLKPKAIFTTNYDQLIELGYKHSAFLPDVICDNRVPVHGQLPLYKPHGSLSHGNQPVGQGGLVITQFDYFGMIANYRSMLEKTINTFGRSCVLIIGYSFGDMDIGSELYRLRTQTAGTPWYTVFPRADPQVRGMYNSRLGIRQIARTFEDFVADLDVRVDFIPDKFKHDKLSAMRTSGIIQ